MNRRKALFLCIFCIVSLLLPACGSKNSPNGKGSINNPYKVGDTIKFTAYAAGYYNPQSVGIPFDITIAAEEVYDPSTQVVRRGAIGDLGNVVKLKFSVNGNYNNSIKMDDLFIVNLLTANREQHERYSLDSADAHVRGEFDQAYSGGSYEVYAIGNAATNDYKYCAIAFYADKENSMQTIYVELT